MGDLFEPYERLIPIYVINKRFEVPENNSILRCFQYLNTATISYGKFCWNGECENCKIHHLDPKTGKEVAVLACQTRVGENLIVTRLSPEIRGIK